MYTFVEDNDYQEEPMYCLSCGWEGLGDQLKKSEVFPVIEIIEVYCPCCSRYMGQYKALDKSVEAMQ